MKTKISQNEIFFKSTKKANGKRDDNKNEIQILEIVTKYSYLNFILVVVCMYNQPKITQTIYIHHPQYHHLKKMKNYCLGS